MQFKEEDCMKGSGTNCGHCSMNNIDKILVGGWSMAFCCPVVQLWG